MTSYQFFFLIMHPGSIPLALLKTDPFNCRQNTHYYKTDVSTPAYKTELEGMERYLLYGYKNQNGKYMWSMDCICTLIAQCDVSKIKKIEKITVKMCVIP